MSDLYTYVDTHGHITLVSPTGEEKELWGEDSSYFLADIINYSDKERNYKSAEEISNLIKDYYWDA